MRVIWAAGILALLLWAGGGKAAETDLQQMKTGVARSKKDLQGLKKKIQQEQQQVRTIRRKESSVLSQLNRLERSLAKGEKELKALDRKLAGITRKAQLAGQDLHHLTRSIAMQEQSMQDRLVALYKFRPLEGVHWIFSSVPAEDLTSSRRYLESILDQDRSLLEDQLRRQDLAEKYRQRLMEDQEELQAIRKQAERKRAEIQTDRLRKSRLLAGVRGEKQVHLAALRELETASGRLQNLIDRLEKEIREKARVQKFVPAGKGFAALRGRLIFPVEGRILSTFGRNENPRFHTFTVQKGIEIETPAGEEIRAVHDGRVLYADWFKGYGKILIIDHGEGYYTLSGHASDLLKKVGENVRAGETVALTGDTGSLKGPCLYFEIRHRGRPLDPLEWLAHQRERSSTSAGVERRRE